MATGRRCAPCTAGGSGLAVARRHRRDRVLVFLEGPWRPCPGATADGRRSWSSSAASPRSSRSICGRSRPTSPAAPDPARRATVLLALLGVAIALAQPQVDWTVLFIVTAPRRAGSPRRAPPPRPSPSSPASRLSSCSRRGRRRLGALESGFEVILAGLVVLGFSQLERTVREPGSWPRPRRAAGRGRRASYGSHGTCTTCSATACPSSL